jgi:hypothetical protein
VWFSWNGRCWGWAGYFPGLLVKELKGEGGWMRRDEWEGGSEEAGCGDAVQFAYAHLFPEIGSNS